MDFRYFRKRPVQTIKQMILETKRLVIRPIALGDKGEIFEYRSDRETNKYQGWIPTTVSDVETFIGKISTQINEPGTWFQFVIVEKEIRKRCPTG